MRESLKAFCVLALLGLSACAGDDANTDADSVGASDGTSEATGTSAGTGTGETSAATGDGDGDGDPSCTPELEAMRDTIFTPSCALGGCHSAADKVAGLDFTVADLEAELVGQPSGTCDGWIRVVPGDPQASLLYAKVAGPAPCGALMPPPAGLDPALVACIGAWIEGIEGMNCETCGGEACVDLDSDPMHCGVCDNACPAGVPCSAGECTCPEGQVLCNGACIDVMSDPQNCGSCGSACNNQVCWMGLCADTCASLTNCDGACVDTNTNPEHCGSCNNACGQGNTCDMGGCDCPGDGVSFAAQVEPVLASNCTSMGCHGFPAPAAGLDLRAGNSYGELVSVPSSQCGNRSLVEPGQPGNSYIMDKLQGVNLCFGTAMPKASPSLPAGEIAAISEWICRGANND